MNKKRILKVSCIGLLTFALACASFLFVPSGRNLVKAASLSGGCRGWCIVSSPNPGTSYNTLSSVSALSTSDIWAVGDESSSTNTQTLIMHWDGSQWSVVSSPITSGGGSGAYLYGVTAVSANNVWAVGLSFGNTGSMTLVEHWNGTAWSVVSSPNPASSNVNILSSVTALSANDIWAVGEDSIVSSSKGGNSGGGPIGTLIEHWNGTAWSIVASPNLSASINQLVSVAAVSATNVWAVGSELDSQTGLLKNLVEHWNGHTWSIVRSPDVPLANNSLSSVTVVSGHNLWAVGSAFNKNGGQNNTLIEQWDGSKWSIVASPNPSSTYNTLIGVASVSAKDVWAVGEDFVSSSQSSKGGNSGGGTSLTLVEHWNGTSWKVVNSASAPSTTNTLDAVTVVPSSTSQAWAVGSYFSNSAFLSLIEEHL